MEESRCGSSASLNCIAAFSVVISFGADVWREYTSLRSVPPMYNIICVQSSTRHPSVGWFAQGSSLSSDQASQDAVFVLFARRYDDDDDDDDRYDCKR